MKLSAVVLLIVVIDAALSVPPAAVKDQRKALRGHVPADAEEDAPIRAAKKDDGSGEKKARKRDYPLSGKIGGAAFPVRGLKNEKDGKVKKKKAKKNKENDTHSPVEKDEADSLNKQLGNGEAVEAVDAPSNANGDNTGDGVTHRATDSNNPTAKTTTNGPPSCQPGSNKPNANNGKVIMTDPPEASRCICNEECRSGCCHSGYFFSKNSAGYLQRVRACMDLTGLGMGAKTGCKGN